MHTPDGTVCNRCLGMCEGRGYMGNLCTFFSILLGTAPKKKKKIQPLIKTKSFDGKMSIKFPKGNMNVLYCSPLTLIMFLGP